MQGDMKYCWDDVTGQHEMKCRIVLYTAAILSLNAPSTLLYLKIIHIFLISSTSGLRHFEYKAGDAFAIECMKNAFHEPAYHCRESATLSLAIDSLDAIISPLITHASHAFIAAPHATIADAAHSRRYRCSLSARSHENADIFIGA